MKIKMKLFVPDAPGVPSAAASVLRNLAALPMNPRVKYRLGRIIDTVNSETKEYEKAIRQTVRELGEPVEWVKKEVVSDGDPNAMEQVVITDPEKLRNSEVLNYRVKAENHEVFTNALADLGDQEVEFKFGPIYVGDLTNAKGDEVDIPFDITPIMWALTDERDEIA